MPNNTYGGRESNTHYGLDTENAFKVILRCRGNIISLLFLGFALFIAVISTENSLLRSVIIINLLEQYELIHMLACKEYYAL